jgi:predicted dehydrogenase
VEDEAAALLEYKNGAVGYIIESVNEVPNGTRIELCGEYGKLVVENQQLQFWKVESGIRNYSDTATEMWGKPGSEQRDVKLVERRRGHSAIVQNVALAIIKGEQLISPGSEAIYSLELANAMLYSGHTGKPVTLPVDRELYNSFIKEKQSHSIEKDVEDQRITDPDHSI